MLDHRAALDGLVEAVAEDFDKAVGCFQRCLRAGGRVFTCGNGGSASDGQHFAAELTGGRRPLPATSLTADTSALSAIANDHGYQFAFSRQLRALGRHGDLLLAISTSGKSANVLNAISAGRELGMFTIGLTGTGGRASMEECDVCIQVPGVVVARIQEMHGLLLHALWESLGEEGDQRPLR